MIGFLLIICTARGVYMSCVVGMISDRLVQPVA
jgi:hypothetical protein